MLPKRSHPASPTPGRAANRALNKNPGRKTRVNVTLLIIVSTAEEEGETMIDTGRPIRFDKKTF